MGPQIVLININGGSVANSLAKAYAERIGGTLCPTYPSYEAATSSIRDGTFPSVETVLIEVEPQPPQEGNPVPGNLASLTTTMMLSQMEVKVVPLDTSGLCM